MDLPLSEDNRRKLRWALVWGLFLTLICGVFFLGLFMLKSVDGLARFISPRPTEAKSINEVFGFAPFWTLSRINNVDWKTLSTFAYFSLPVNYDGSIDRSSYAWDVFEGARLEALFDKAKSENVRRVVTLTQIERPTIETFLADESSWERVARESVDIVKSRGLDGVNIDFEYIPSNHQLRERFSQFIERYSDILNRELKDPYITVSVLASSERFNRIYDIGRLAKLVNGIFMMAYDYYYPGSETVGPSAPLYGYNNGKGPFWYDVSTAVDDFLKVAPASKIIMGVPYYGWNYETVEPYPRGTRGWGRAVATTNKKVSDNKLSVTTPIGGWDSQAQVAWRGYWDENSWHVVYIEDEKSLAAKYDFAKSRNLAGVGIWALGFEDEGTDYWEILSSALKEDYLSMHSSKTWIF